MKAIGLTGFGGPEVLQPIELPSPDAGPGEMRIRVRAATVNPADRNIRTGIYAEPPSNPVYVPGMEAAGVLEQIGDGVQTDLRVGDRVIAIVVPHGAYGAYAEQITVPAESVVRAPSNATDAEAATLPMNSLTARLAVDALELEAGQTIGVTGAAGAVGGYAIQLAKAAGLRVIADAAPADKQLVAELGADVVVSRGPEFADQVRAEVPEGVDGLVDAAAMNEAVVSAVRDGGRIATLRGFRGREERGVTFQVVLVSQHARAQSKLDRLRQQVEDGQLTLRVAQAFPADQADAAHRLLDAGGVRGRLVLEFQD